MRRKRLRGTICLPRTIFRPSGTGRLLVMRVPESPPVRLAGSETVLQYTVCTPHTRKAASEEQEAQSVTEGLVELRQMMHGQVQHSQETLRVLGKTTHQAASAILCLPG